MPVMERLDQIVGELYPQMEADLLKLLEFPSVRGKAEPGAPYGKVLADCLNHSLNRGAELGFIPHNEGGYFGLLDWLAETLPPEKQVGLLSHLDVVPAVAEDWRYAPYAPQVAEGRIYGRGAVDDKGPFVAALYATYAVRRYCEEEGLTPKYGVRHIIGCNEENGMECVQRFLQIFPQPYCGFAPDSSFPAVIGEKGIIHLEYSREFTSTEEAAGDLLLQSIHGGTGGNVVPGEAEAKLYVTTAGLADAQAAWTALPPAEREKITLEQDDQQPGCLCVRSIGTAGHASLPELCDNALSRLLRYLATLPLAPTEEAAFAKAAAQLLAQDDAGTGLKIDSADEISTLTAVLSILHLDETQGQLHLDIRYPISGEEADCRRKLEDVALAQGWQIHNWMCHTPTYTAETETPARELLAVFRQKTGDTRPPIITGGGTYARMMKRFVAFGPELGDEPSTAHQADENIRQENLLLAAQVYARALYKLCVEAE